jgi:hypothetical protein
MRLWDLETGELMRVFDIRPEHEGLGWVGCVLSPDGNTALSGATDNLVRLWDLESGEEIRRMEGHTDWLTAMTISPDGQQALTGAFREPTVILWDVDSGELIHRLIGTGGTIDLAFSPDGRNALSTHFDSTLILWDLESGEQVRRFIGHRDFVWGVDFTPDGRRAVSSASDGTLILWDVATGQEIRRYVASDVEIRVTEVTPDGHHALAGFTDGTVILWDLESGEVMRQFHGHEGDITNIDISHDGRTAVTGGGDFVIIQWRLATPELEELLAWIDTNRYVRELNCEERELYQIKPLCEVELVEAKATPEPMDGGLEAPDRIKHTAQVGENRGEIVLGDFQIWLYEGQVGEVLTIRVLADNPADNVPYFNRLEHGVMDTVLYIISPDGTIIAMNDDAETIEMTTNSLIEGLVLPVDGTYRIEVHSVGGLNEGAYTLIIESSPPSASETPTP